MKVALITDQHFGARNDSVAFLDFFEKFYENVFFPKIDEAIIRAHIDLPNRDPKWLTTSMVVPEPTVKETVCVAELFQKRKLAPALVDATGNAQEMAVVLVNSINEPNAVADSVVLALIRVAV